MNWRLCVLFCAIVPSLSAQAPSDEKADVVKFHATSDNVKFVFGPAAPVAHVKPGNILDANSLDCFGNALQKPGDTMAMVKGDNPLTGPFYIEGAVSGDAIAVTFQKIRMNRNWGFTNYRLGLFALTPNSIETLYPGRYREGAAFAGRATAVCAVYQAAATQVVSRLSRMTVRPRTINPGVRHKPRPPRNAARTPRLRCAQR